MPGESQKVPESKPDPTVMTTEQLDRSIEANEKQWRSELAGEKRVTDQRFREVSEQLATFERLRVEQKADTKTGVDDALKAAKELVALQTKAASDANEKTEKSFADQLSQVQLSQKSGDDARTRELNELRERVGRIENLKAGGTQAYAGLYAFAAFIAVLLAIAASVIAFTR